MSQIFARLFGFLFLLSSINCLAVEIPKSLEEWKPWILEKHPDLNCPFIFNDGERTCVWPSELKIEANSSGASFSQRIDVFKNEWVKLPGNVGLWPQNVSDNNAKATVRDKNNSPEIYLTIGSHDISGDIRWSEMPRTLPISEQTGIVQLTLNGKAVSTPAIESNNQLWLAANEKQNAAAHQDTFDVRVFRKIEDTIPLRMTTQLQIDVSGKERELQLGQVLLNGFSITEFNSALPARIEKDGSLRIQVKPGSWEITLTSQSNGPANDLTFKATSDLWPTEEVWVFAAERQLRSVQISGVQTIDPQQTQLPEEWKNLPAYLVTPETHFKIEELQRGETKNVGNKLELNRNAWLSFSGEQFIASDRITGTTQNSRLETIQPLELTNADIASKPQLITLLNNSKNTGIEIRTRDINILGTSHLPRNLTLPITGWNEEFDSVSTRLNLPPGWSLFTATGTSSQYGSWISKWTLWDMFLVLIIIVSIARLIKPAYGLVAAVTLILIYNREGAPVYVWLNLITAIALATFVSGKFKHFIVKYTYVSFFLLALVILPFTVHEARTAINPQLDNEPVFSLTPSLIQTSNKKKMAYAPAPAISVMEDAVSAEDIGKMPDMNVAESLQRISGASMARSKEAKQISKKYDLNQQTQTGLAAPDWYANYVNLHWTGPIKADETTKLFLVSPLFNRLGYLLSALLPLLLAGILLRHFFEVINKPIAISTFSIKTNASAISSLLLIALFAFPSDSANAQTNANPDILKELEARLTEAPRCLPDCAAIESAAVTLKQDQLTIDLVVHSNDLIALPLPADHEQWWPSQVTLDGKNALLVQSDDQTLLASLPKGRHNLSIKANLQGRDALNIEFPLALHNVASTVNGWEMSGLPSVEQTSQSLQLQRVERDENQSKSEHLRLDPIAPFVSVKRELKLDLEWTVTTTVTRVSPAFGAINIEVPVIEGEAPLTTQLTASGKVAIHLEANQQEFSWTSNIKQMSVLQLKAAQNVPWFEIWSLDASAIWHIDAKGIAPIQMIGNNLPTWQPWPGESVSLGMTRPQAAKGSYITIDSSHLSYVLGERSNLATLSLTIRSNQGGQYNFNLPADSKLSALEIDNQPISVSATNNQIKIPLHPGKQNVVIRLNSDKGVSVFTKTPEFTLDQGSSNQRIDINLPGNRWVLLLGGPKMGPSILIWGMLFVVVLISIGLGRAKLTPLKSHEWVILSLGVCTLNFFTFVVVAVWLIMLQQRGHLAGISSARKFKFLQVGLFLLSVLALGLLITTIPEGLLGSPDMRVAGNDSNDGLLRWYQDHSDSAFPTAWVISLPLWCYKIAILLWSLWLASSLIKWIRWGWQQLSHNGMWHVNPNIIEQPIVKVDSTENNQSEK
jgi:hypothetical protein